MVIRLPNRFKNPPNPFHNNTRGTTQNVAVKGVGMADAVRHRRVYAASESSGSCQAFDLNGLASHGTINVASGRRKGLTGNGTPWRITRAPFLPSP